MRRGFWLRFAEAILRPSLTVLTRRDWRGQENVPATGPAILVVNHLSHADPPVIAHYVYDLPRGVHFLAKASLWRVPVLGAVLRGSGQIPVLRDSRDAGKALDVAVERIRAGEAPIIYPEGTTTHDPGLWPMQGKTGAARLWFATGAPVIPIVNWGPQRIYDPVTEKLRLRPRTPVTVSAGPAVDLAAFVGREPTAEVLREVTDVIMRRLRDDLAAIRREPAPTGPLHAPDDRPRAAAGESDAAGGNDAAGGSEAAGEDGGARVAEDGGAEGEHETTGEGPPPPAAPVSPEAVP